MVLGILFGLVTAVFEVTGRNTVRESGVMPREEASATFTMSAVSGAYGQMTAGNTTTLKLGGWDGATIRRVVLEMRSNKTSGAGLLIIKSGANVLWNIQNAAFSSESWHGAYSTEYVDVTHSMVYTVGEDEMITIHIEATKNSLYIHKYTIEYEPKTPVAHTVCFRVMGTETGCMTEKEVGSGIVLPTMPDSAEWRFTGWSRSEIANATNAPAMLMPGSVFYPKDDGTLWAVYTNEQPVMQMAKVVSGSYVLGFKIEGWALTGVPNDGYMNIIDVCYQLKENGLRQLLSATHDADIFDIELLTDSTLMLYSAATGTPIGCNSKGKMVAEDIAWRYIEGVDSTLLLYVPRDAARSYMLTVGRRDGDDKVRAWMSSVSAGTFHTNGLLLFAAAKEPAIWTTEPVNASVDVITSPKANGERTVVIGLWEMEIRDGKKYIKCNR